MELGKNLGNLVKTWLVFGLQDLGKFGELGKLNQLLCFGRRFGEKFGKNARQSIRRKVRHLGRSPARRSSSSLGRPVTTVTSKADLQVREQDGAARSTPRSIMSSTAASGQKNPRKHRLMRPDTCVSLCESSPPKIRGRLFVCSAARPGLCLVGGGSGLLEPIGRPWRRDRSLSVSRSKQGATTDRAAVKTARQAAHHDGEFPIQNRSLATAAPRMDWFLCKSVLLGWLGFLSRGALLSALKIHDFN